MEAFKASEAKPILSGRGSEAANLAGLFASSPFAGLDMDFERDGDLGREIGL